MTNKIGKTIVGIILSGAIIGGSIYGLANLAESSYNRGFRDGSKKTKEELIMSVVNVKKNIMSNLRDDSINSMERLIQSLTYASYIEQTLHDFEKKGYFIGVSDSVYQEAFNKTRENK